MAVFVDCYFKSVNIRVGGYLLECTHYKQTFDVDVCQFFFILLFALAAVLVYRYSFIYVL